MKFISESTSALGVEEIKASSWQSVTLQIGDVLKDFNE